MQASSQSSGFDMAMQLGMVPSGSGFMLKRNNLIVYQQYYVIYVKKHVDVTWECENTYSKVHAARSLSLLPILHTAR